MSKLAKNYPKLAEGLRFTAEKLIQWKKCGRQIEVIHDHAVGDPLPMFQAMRYFNGGGVWFFPPHLPTKIKGRAELLWHEIFMAHVGPGISRETLSKIAISLVDEKYSDAIRELEAIHPNIATGELVVRVDCRVANSPGLNLNYKLQWQGPDTGGANEYIGRCGEVFLPGQPFTTSKILKSLRLVSIEPDYLDRFSFRRGGAVNFKLYTYGLERKTGVFENPFSDDTFPKAEGEANFY